MDLGLRGRKALVCASSQGLGLACAEALAAEGCEVWINGRDALKLAGVAAELQKRSAAVVHAVAADLNTEAGRAALLAACPAPDILVNNNAGPPTGTTPPGWRRCRPT
jgi:3-oxoacyl-[acyl-carrier protein] reductase